MHTQTANERQTFWANLPLPEMPPVTVGVMVKNVWLKMQMAQNFGSYMNISKEDVMPISVCEVYGVTYITALNFRTYVRAPMINLYTGMWEECWLEQLPTEGMRSYDANPAPLPTPDIMEVFKDTLPKESSRRFKDTLPKESSRRHKSHQTIEGYISPGHTCSIVSDRKGRYWQSGSDSVNAFFFRVPHTKRVFVMYPAISAFEQREDETWLVEHHIHYRNASRITFCTYDVRKVIEESGLWEYYNPKGKAQTDPDVAREELKNLDKTSPLLKDAKNMLKDFEKTKFENANMMQEIQKLKADLDAAKKSIKENEKVIKDLSAENDLLKETSSNARSMKDYDNFSPIFK